MSSQTISTMIFYPQGYICKSGGHGASSGSGGGISMKDRSKLVTILPWSPSRSWVSGVEIMTKGMPLEGPVQIVNLHSCKCTGRRHLSTWATTDKANDI